jgi:transmembrane protein EpsG
VDRALRKKWDSFVLWTLLAVTFHPYAVMYLVVPFMMYRPWSGKTYVSLTTFALAGMLLESMLGTIVDITSMFGEGYNVSEFSGEGVNPFRLAVVAVPLVLSFVASPQIAAMDEKQERQYFLFVNLAILNAEIMFVALFGTANYFARLANYFALFQALSIPWLFQFFETKSRRLLTIMAVAGYSLFFLYENAINRSFNADYDSISLIEYLRSLS